MAYASLWDEYEYDRINDYKEPISIVHFKRRMPYNEMNFINLYSWSKSTYITDNNFSRVFNKSVFESIKQYFQTIGYSFTELYY